MRTDKEENITQFDILDVIPHASPMCLLDSVKAYSKNSVTCLLTVNPDKLFFDVSQNGIPSYVGIEYMAQTIAAFAGVHEQLAGEKPKLGFLLGSRKYAPDCSIFPNNSTLQVHAEQVIQEESGLFVFDCTISIDNMVVVNAKINAFQPPDAEAYLNSVRNNGKEE